jgi:hypothetical protein
MSFLPRSTPPKAFGLSDSFAQAVEKSPANSWYRSIGLNALSVDSLSHADPEAKQEPSSRVSLTEGVYSKRGGEQ